MSGIENAILLFISNVYSAIQWPGVVLLMAIESANIPLPSEVILPLAGWMLIKDKGLSASYVLLAGGYGALGCLLGSWVSYAAGAWGGRPFLYKYGKYLLISRRDLDTADRWFEKRGDLAIFISRLLPVVRTFISFPAGVARMPLLKFSIYTFIGSFIWSAALAYGGYLLGAHWDELRAFMRPLDPLIIAVIVILAGLYVYRHVRHLREQPTDHATPPNEG